MRYVRVLSVGLLVACGDPAGPSVGAPASASLVGEALAGTVAAPINVVVRVTDTSDTPVPNRLVNFVVVSGAGSVFAGSALTDAAGEAKEVWTLGTVAGEQTLEARWVGPNGQPVVLGSFAATAKPGPAVTQASIGGADRVGFVGQTVTFATLAPFTAAKDAYGNAVGSNNPSYTASTGLTTGATGVTVDSIGSLSLRVVVGDLEATRTVYGFDDPRAGVTLSSRCVDASADSIVYSITGSPTSVSGTATVTVGVSTYVQRRAEYTAAGTSVQTVGPSTVTLVLRADSILWTGGGTTYSMKRSAARRYATTAGVTLCPVSFATRGDVRLVVRDP